MIKKKATAILLALVMALSLLPAQALAAETGVYAVGEDTAVQTTVQPLAVSADDITGTGTETDPYRIYTASGLKAFRDKVNNGETSACAQLEEDIVLNAGTFDENGNWSGNGTPEVWVPFDSYYGTFNGNGHTISGLYVTGVDYAGLFSSVRGGTVKDLAVTGYVQGQTFAGGIAAVADSGRIENCVNLCRVVAEGNDGPKQAHAGGIVGRDAGGAILNCANLGAISCNVEGWIQIAYAAGIAGWVDNTTITRCYNVGGISENGIGVHGSGGIAGHGTSVNVSHCCWLAGAVQGVDDTADDAKTKVEFANDVLSLLQDGDKNSPWTKTGYNSKLGMTLPLLVWQTGDGHQHDYQWQHNDTQHWKECACGAIEQGSKAAHTEKTGNCRDGIYCECGYLMHPATGGHDWTAWQHQTTSHTRHCQNPGCGMTQSENCSDENKDHKCDTCDAVISDHSGGTATCKDQAVCAVCGAEYGQLDPNNHVGGTDLKNAKAATCTEKGYTGDTYCKGCGVKVSDGKDIPSAGHDLKHVDAKRSTTRTEGNSEYWYCDSCGKYFKDAAAVKEITKADTVIAKRSGNSGSSGTTSGTASNTGKDTVKSSDTGDAGIALYGVMALLSLSGGAWLTGKKRK